MEFKHALKDERPLKIVGVINAFVGMMAQKVGFKALYLSGAGVANSSFGLPDLGMTSLNDVAEEARRLLHAINVPLLVDIDTGWGTRLNIRRSIQILEKMGVAAVHIEDQQFGKRCGHRSGIQLVSKEEMCDRIKAAVAARVDPHFVIMARTDSLGIEGFDSMLARVMSYKAAGADMIFLEAFKELDDYHKVKRALNIPILANMTEFGKTPLFNTDELASAGVDMVLYPLSVNRIMNACALDALQEIKRRSSQKELVKKMQTREELYQFLNYESYEKSLDGGIP